MNESQFFADALMFASPAERAAYLDEACAGNPEARAAVEALLRAHDRDPGFLEQPAGSLGGTVDVPADPRPEDYARRFPELGPGRLVDAIVPGAATPAAAAAATPERIGRYRVEKILGQGGFGLVYLAHDEQLQRPVAIKVPHRRLVTRPEDAQAYLTEARTVAGLDHIHIVPVYDVGSTEDCPCFIVSKFIEGSTLAQKIKGDRPPFGESMELVATIAETLHYAHKQGIVHRDIKPSNILLDNSGKPFVADFGLALREQDVGKGPRYAGTPAYMSPEQARGEGHRVDGRSDIFSLGVVFYQLLTGRRPFHADSREELLEQITNMEVRPPRQWDDTIPKELERICLKALSKRTSERYTTAKDMGDDLRHFLPSPVPTPSDQQAVKIVPKGLRSFDAGDADFFLELLPGPRDREGLPDSIRFWKTRIETTDADSTFAVGLIYGPSGCGKSSLVKAGLLPRLAKSVMAVYIEATADETDARLLKGLRRQVVPLPGNLGLVESLAELRRGRFLESGQKVLLVLDQFEQWLHAKRNEENTELVHALRQCDGGQVQCIVMVRDDFWMAATRFMANLEISLVQGQNSAAVDLFDPRHARKVLTAFGRAFSALPEQESLAKDQHAFLDQAVAGLAQDGKVISVRLALFAEMVKGKPWTPATLREVGGTEGVGVTFLEETFTASTALPQHRLHQKAAQTVLKALLPESGTDIKGHMRSQQELLEASGYASRPRDFDALLRILDSELRLITPTDPEGKDDAAPSTVQSGQKYCQLTHDYLVPSLREWLTRKQKETRRGRAELLLADRAAVWNARPENRQLPSLLQWSQIRWLTQKKNWTPPQKKLMRKASRVHALRGLVVGVLLALATVTGVVIRNQVVEYQKATHEQAEEKRKATHAAGLVQAVVNAETAQVPGIVGEIAEYRKWTDPLLQEEYDKAAGKPRQKLHASLALLPVDASQVEYLSARLLDAEPHEVPVIRNALAAHQSELVNKLWAVVKKPEKGKESQRLRAAAALAKYDPESNKWTKVREQVVNDLVKVPAVYLKPWMDSFRPVQEKFQAPLAVVYRDGKRRETERSLATDLLADYAADQPRLLADLLMDADEQQFAVLYPKFKDQKEHGLPVLTGEIDKKLPPELPSSDERREKLAKRQANAAVALLRMNQTAKVWPLLKHSPDPRVRSYLIHRLSPFGADAKAIIRRLDEEPEVSIRRALLLSLGEYRPDQLSTTDREPLLSKVLNLYRDDPDPGLHGAAEWLLRQWKKDKNLKEMNEQWAKDQPKRATRLEQIKQELVKGQGKAEPQWYVNGQGQTMVVIPGPVEFLMGSPSTEVGRDEYESQHEKRIGRSFAIAAREVTVEQFLRFRKDHGYSKKYAPTLDCPVNIVTWYNAAAYCNWLSKKEGIHKDQWCYLPNDEGEYAEGMKLAPDYLKRTGYRLPSEAEWEYACRAGAVTSRYYGETEDLLGMYVWYTKNSLERGMLPGVSGSLGVKGDCLKPNDYGMFDLLGNALEWCQESAWGYIPGKDGKPSEDIEDKRGITDKLSRVLRGGSFFYRASTVRSASRGLNGPASRLNINGFRPARTFSP